MPLSRYLRMKIRSPSNAHIPKRNQITEQIEISLRWSAGTYSTSLGFHGCSWVGNSVLDNAGPYYASFLKAFTCIERLPASRRKNARSSSVSLANHASDFWPWPYYPCLLAFRPRHQEVSILSTSMMFPFSVDTDTPTPSARSLNFVDQTDQGAIWTLWPWMIINFWPICAISLFSAVFQR